MYPPFCFVSIIYFKLHSYVVIKMKDEIFCFHMHEGVRDLNDFSLYTLKFLTAHLDQRVMRDIFITLRTLSSSVTCGRLMLFLRLLWFPLPIKPTATI